MEDLEQQIKNNIDALIYQRYTNGVESLSLPKLMNYVSNKFGIDIDEDDITAILTDNVNVESVVDDKILLGKSEQKSEDDNINDEVHDGALDQISDHMEFESVVDVLTKLKTGKIIDSRLVRLDESDVYYPLHYGSQKAKATYVISEVQPKKKLTESVIRCKVNGTPLFINLPVTSFLKK